MNILEFEVSNRILKRIDSQDVMNRNENVYKCQFTFEDESDWIDLNKFVIFKDGWGNTTTVHLGKEGNVLLCLIPDKVLKGSYFQVSIYAGNLMTTNPVTVALIQSGYNNIRYPHHHYPYGHPHFPYDNPKPHLHHPHKEGDIFVEIFDRLDNSIDSVVYDDNTLYLFCQGELKDLIYLPYITKDEFEVLATDVVTTVVNNQSTASSESNGLMSKEDKAKLDSIEENANYIIVDNELDENSSNPIANHAVTKALDGKEDSYDMVEKIDNLILNLINTNGE